MFKDGYSDPAIILIDFFQFFELNFRAGLKIIMKPFLRGRYVPFDHKSIIIEKSNKKSN
jgi:hypothetical protein